MPKKIDREERIELILNKSLEVFASNGYKNTTLSLIAQECNLSRTTVYEYFKSTDEILSFTVKKYTDRMLDRYKKVQWQDVRLIVNDIIATADTNKDSISALIKALNIKDFDIHNEIKRRTVQLRLYLCRLIRKEKGAKYRNVNAEQTVNSLFVLLESYCFEKIFFGEAEAALMKDVIEQYLQACLYQ